MKNLKFKHLLSVFCFVVLATTLVACKSASVVPPTITEKTITKTVTEVVRDTVFEVQKDSSFYKAYLECVEGKVVIKENTKPVTTKGKYLQPPKVNITDNVLQVDCEAEAQKLFFQWKEKYIQAVVENMIKHPYIVEKELSWWQITQMYLGRILIIFAVLLGLGFAFKNRI